jgi:uncharacterized short protein YbdD (DUF466 family)
MIIERFFRRCWQAIRSISGDDAYDRYVAHCHTHHPGQAMPSRHEFYRREQERRWSGGPNRCC